MGFDITLYNEQSGNKNNKYTKVISNMLALQVWDPVKRSPNLLLRDIHIYFTLLSIKESGSQLLLILKRATFIHFVLTKKSNRMSGH
jgi:hypothetical protein